MHPATRNVSARRHSPLVPGLKHQSIVQILRDEPQLVTMFLGRSGFRLPSGAMPVIVDSDLSHRDPGMLKELLSDSVFLYKAMEENVAVVVEVQTSRPKHEHQLAWPCYVTSARAVYDCKAYMLVLAASRGARTGSERAIEIGQPGFTFLPFVSGHGHLPPPGGPFFGPELTMLHVLTGTLDLSVHEARMFALASIRAAPPDRYRRYVHLIRIFTPRHARHELEQLMEDLFKDPFIDRFLEEGKQLGIERGMEQGMQQGKRIGRAESAARVLVTILAARGIAIADQVRARITECTDPDLLERWATRAATCSTIDEVFAS